jgi:chromate reductase, NAD(P)H dehydrogenase (quinone)
MLNGDVLSVSGSLRRGSYNTALLREAANALPSGVDHGWLDGIAGLPPYSEDDDGERAPAAVERLSLHDRRGRGGPDRDARVQRLDPGRPQERVDWASRPFPDNPWRDKPVAVIGASTGIFGAVWAPAARRESLRGGAHLDDDRRDRRARRADPHALAD